MKRQQHLYKLWKTTFGYFFIVCFSLTFFLSCYSVKHAGSKSGKRLYETFFVGEEGTQYFIKPLSFINKTAEELKLDITFRYKNVVKDSATVNITFHAKNNLKSLDSLKITNMVFNTTISEMKYLFSERNSDMYNCRFSSKVPLADAEKLFENNQWIITQYNDHIVTKYMPSPSTNEAIGKLDYEIFSLF
jgi:hypothetical protein